MSRRILDIVAEIYVNQHPFVSIQFVSIQQMLIVLQNNSITNLLNFTHLAQRKLTQYAQVADRLITARAYHPKNLSPINEHINRA